VYEHPPRRALPKAAEGRSLPVAVYRAIRSALGPRTLHLLRFDLARARARLRGVWRGDHRAKVAPPRPLIHLGCGSRRVNGWLNVDVIGSEFDLDLAGGHLPWVDASADAFVAQHVIEHLELDMELVPLLTEMRRVLRPDGEVWLSCPDLAAICRSYVDGALDRLIDDRRVRFPDWRFEGVPHSQIVNDLFTQEGEHVNLFDEELLRWALLQAGFTTVERVREGDLLARFPGFPERHDDMASLYVRASGVAQALDAARVRGTGAG
jgi:predicted SAM-dependent methyltransferase